MRRTNNGERSRIGPAADRHARELSIRLGRSLRHARANAGLSQAVAAARAGISQGAWSRLETNGDPRYTLATWDRAAFAVGMTLNAYMPETSAADKPRDAAQLKAQELVIATAKSGGWHGLPEEQIDREARTSRFADVILQRPRRQPREIALIEIIDWFEDVGAPMRDWPRRLEATERRAIGRIVADQPVPKVSGCWVIRATQRNRDLVGEHSNLFRNRFPGSGRAWLAALVREDARIPAEAAMLWVSVDGARLFEVRAR